MTPLSTQEQRLLAHQELFEQWAAAHFDYWHYLKRLTFQLRRVATQLSIRQELKGTGIAIGPEMSSAQQQIQQHHSGQLLFRRR
jgi:hypothetical protein